MCKRIQESQQQQKTITRGAKDMIATLAFLVLAMTAFSADFRYLMKAMFDVTHGLSRQIFTLKNILVFTAISILSLFALKIIFNTIGLAWVIIIFCLPISIISLWRKKKLGLIATWLVILSTGTLGLSSRLEPILIGLSPLKKVIAREVGEWSSETNTRSLAESLQGITKVGVRAYTKRVATMLLEDGQSINLPKFTEVLVTPEKTRQQSDSETEVWVSLKNADGDFIGGRTGWLPASILTYTNVKNISSDRTAHSSNITSPTHSTTGATELRDGGEFEINFIPDSYNEIDLGWKKIDVPSGEYCVNSMSGWFKQALFNEKGEVVYFDIPPEGRNFLNFIPHCPISGKKFGVPILKIEGSTIPLQQGTCFSITKEASMSANIPTNWSDIGTNYQLWFSENKGPGFKITLSPK